jgi:hypothetical protein
MKLLKYICLASVVWTSSAAFAQISWQDKLQNELPLLGDRNWIAIVDSAYPLQTAPGVETIETQSSEVDVARQVLDDLSHTRNVRPVIYMDAELPYVPEKDAPGIAAYRREMHSLLGNLPVEFVPHEKTIAQLNEKANVFRVVILKTTLTVPYSSIFILLKCGYWSDAAEIRLRQAMKEEVKTNTVNGR